MLATLIKWSKKGRAREHCVLIVDDSKVVRQVLAMTLQDAGFSVIEASNGKEAIKLAKKYRFEFVITDIKMPKMDGLELIRKLRKMRQYKKTPILSLTNLNSDHFKTELKQAGATGWVNKPFGRHSLLNTIEKLVA